MHDLLLREDKSIREVCLTTSPSQKPRCLSCHFLLFKRFTIIFSSEFCSWSSPWHFCYLQREGVGKKKLLAHVNSYSWSTLMRCIEHLTKWLHLSQITLCRPVCLGTVYCPFHSWLSYLVDQAFNGVHLGIVDIGLYFLKLESVTQACGCKGDKLLLGTC